MNDLFTSIIEKKTVNLVIILLTSATDVSSFAKKKTKYTFKHNTKKILDKVT